MQETKETSLITKKDLRSVFWRSFTMQSSWSFDKMMACGFMYSIEKPLRKIYPKDDDYFEALHRHTETFNITPHVSPFVIDLSVAMEQECAKADNFNKESINNLKVGLMGPLSGIGDSFFWVHSASSRPESALPLPSRAAYWEPFCISSCTRQSIFLPNILPEMPVTRWEPGSWRTLRRTILSKKCPTGHPYWDLRS